jgi:hypothetical protein
VTALRTLFVRELAESVTTADRPLWVIDGTNWPRPAARANVDADLLVRLIKSRVVYRVPEQRAGRGRPRLHGEPSRLADERTHGQPHQSTELDHPVYGTVQIDAWTNLHVSGAPGCAVQRDPRAGRAPAQQEAATSAVVVGLDWWSAAA